MASNKQRFSVQCSRIGESEHVAPWYTVADVRELTAAIILSWRYERIGERTRVWDNATGAEA